MSKNKIICCLLAAFLLLCFSTLQAQNQERTVIDGREFYQYQVQRGEGFFAIGNRFGVTQEELLRYNPELADGLRAYQIILIPVRTTNETTVTEPSPTRTYVVMSGETIFSISQQFGIRPTDLIAANPDLRDGLRAGQTIIIPLNREVEVTPTVPTIPDEERRPTIRHLVQSQETIFSIAQSYNVTQNDLIRYNPELRDGLQAGRVILIPVTVQDNRRVTTADLDGVETIQPRANDDVIRVAFMLPFMLDEGTTTPATEIFYDFYQGALLAIDSLRRAGLSIDVYAFDTGKDNSRIASILQNDALRNVDIIFGPAYTEQIAPIANFARANGIRLVVPFSSRTEATFTHENIFQPNPSQDVLNREIINAFVNTFSDRHIVILRFGEALPNSIRGISDSISLALRQHGISFVERTVPPDSVANYQTVIGQLLSSEKENIILPMTINPSVLTRIMSSINRTQGNFSLFGFYEWTTLGRIQEEIFTNTTYISALFYLDYESRCVRQFFANYLDIFGNEMSMNFPHFNLLGYDMTLFFLSGIHRFGDYLEKNLDRVNANTLQVRFNFEKVGERGGYMNSNVFLVRHQNGRSYKIPQNR